MLPAMILFKDEEKYKGGSMSTQIYYFSGTGNSLYAARELSKRLPGSSLTPVCAALSARSFQSRAQTVGFVFPIHCLGVPEVVMEFLKHLRLDRRSYVFALVTRESSAKVRKDVDKYLRDTQKKLDAFFQVQMPETYLPIFDVEDPAECTRKEEALHHELTSIAGYIQEKRPCVKPDPKVPGMYVYYALRPLIRFLFRKTHYFGLPGRFYADETCTGCAVCSEVCLSGRINMSAGKPQWSDATPCFLCFACIHFCPSQAVQIRGAGTGRKGRYHHQEISWKDIAAQKGQ